MKSTKNKITNIEFPSNWENSYLIFYNFNLYITRNYSQIYIMQMNSLKSIIYALYKYN